MAGFEETVKDFWRSRPARPARGRKVAGVAAAIGYRYGIDPIVIRVALVAATVFGGFGVFAYLLGWLFLPQEGDQVSAFEGLIGKGRSSLSPAFAVLLIILLFPGITWTFSGGWLTDGSGLIGFALMAAALYLLHRNRGQFNRPVAPAPAYPTAAFSMSSASAPASTTADGGWDPLAADPSGWDLPTGSPSGGVPPQSPPPPAAPPAPRGRKSKIGVTTFGVASLVAGVGVVAGLDGEPWFTLQHVIGLTLGVVGIGLVAGSFVRGGRGLIGLAVPLAIAGMVLTTAPFENFSVQGGGLGDLSETPRTASEVKSEYKRSAGDIDLDLTQLASTTTPITTKVTTGAGSSTVIVPQEAEVKVVCETQAGDLNCLGQSQSGVGLDTIDFTSPGTNGQKIVLHVESGVGNVEVRRG